MRRLYGLLYLILALGVLPAISAELPIPPAPSHFVTDETQFLSQAARKSLDKQLSDYSRTSGVQLIVYIDKSTGDTPLEDWTVKAFEKWKVGQKGLDNGVALFLFVQDRKLRIEVGYGLEGKLPDALASRIINDVIKPKLMTGANDDAIFAGASAIVQSIAGEQVQAGKDDTQQGYKGQKRELTASQIIIFIIFAVGFIILLITNPTLAMFLLFSILSGGRGGGGRGGGGGGFSGGGGRSGGGGASGSW